MNTFIRLITLGIFTLAIVSCTRAGVNVSSKLTLKMPENISALDLGTLPSNINCFFVAVGGPEPEMRKNTCQRLGPNPGAYTVGTWAGGIPRDAEVSLDVPSGKDRVIYLAGFEATTAAFCSDFKKNGFPSDSPDFFYLGEVSGVDLEPGKVVTVPLEVTYDSTDIVDNCNGPDFPDDGNQGPYFRIEGIGQHDSGLDLERATRGLCYPVQIRMFEGMGTPWPNPGVANIQFGNFPAEFHASPSCTGGISNVFIPPASNQSSQFYFRSPVVATFSSPPLTVSGTTENLDFYQTFEIGDPKISIINGPQTLPVGGCAAYEARLQKHEDNGDYSAPAGGVVLQLSENASFKFRSDILCVGSNIATIPPATSSVFVYLEMLSASTVVDFFDYIGVTTPASGINVMPFVVTEPN